MIKYAITVMDEGLAVTAPIPADHMRAIAKMAETLGFDIIAADIGQCLGGFFFTNRKGALAMRAVIDLQNSSLPPEDQWANGWDRGTSSETIFYFMTGRPRDEGTHEDVPHDPDDFGRCFRLLDKFPAWHARLPEMAAAKPEWKGLIDNWGYLERIYAEGDTKELYRRIQDLTTEARS